MTLLHNEKNVWRKKARTNILIAKELAEIFGGKKADYLKRLNHRLRIKIAMNFVQPMAKVA
jgi:hypothetical protein